MDTPDPKSVRSDESLSEQRRQTAAHLAASKDDGFPALPTPPLLGFSDVSLMAPFGGRFGHGIAKAGMAIADLEWVFGCHFPDDPVVPGTMLTDALLQLTGFFGGCVGLRGRGRALQVGRVKFLREVTPAGARLVYSVDVQKVSTLRQLVLAQGEVHLDGVLCMTASDLLVKVLP